LCSLLPRFYDVSEGSIQIDGTDIRDLTLSSLRKNIGTVQQDVFLFAGTLKENVAYGKTDATDEEVYYALRKAQLKELVDNYRDVIAPLHDALPIIAAFNTSPLILNT